MWESWFGSTTTDNTSQLADFFSSVGNDVNSFITGVVDPGSVAAGSNDAGDVGKQIGVFLNDVGNSMMEMYAKATTPEQDKEVFAHVKHFGELPDTCIKPVPKKYFPQNLKDELFQDEWEAFLELKKLPCCEGFSDRFLMACLFARKLDVTRTQTMLENNKRWREENGYREIPKWESLNRARLEEGRFGLKIPGSRGRNGEGIIYVRMGRMFPGKWPDFIETCIQWTVWNGMQGGLYESMDYFRNGIMMIADLENMGWDNIDLTLQNRMSSALLDNFPMRTCKILILNPPWILNAFLDALRLVIKKKVMDRVCR
eukprot:TRINITY_DN14619_c0_g1_i6.p1 TRINITY_DN14619_c0_g1~~TRINITY_DN14619_c0_g1_i6.p1  ORF type:complete len:314 (-),score=44.65 TRINITY_DN14619_c0_g1_i6:320-1261(-)